VTVSNTLVLTVVSTPPRRADLGWRAAALAASIGLAVLAAYLVRSSFVMTLLTQAVISGILATGVGFLIRQNGVVSFGHAAFYGLAAYIIALSLKHVLLGAEGAIVVALAVPTALAFLLGLVIVRMPGIAFSMLTLAVGQALFEFAMKARHATGGEDGLAMAFPAHVFGVTIGTLQRPASMFVICWSILALLVFGLSVLSQSPFGRLTVAIRENEERARFIGYATLVPRALTFALSAFVAALAGVLFALYNAFVSPDALHWSLSGSALIMAIIGGAKLLWGPALGAVIFFFAKDIAGNFTEHWQSLVGVLLIVVTVLLPSGIGGALQKLARGRGAGRES
jgi:branched-chain amino acid transport system permease protein